MGTRNLFREQGVDAKAAEYIDRLMQLPSDAVMRALAEEAVVNRAQREWAITRPHENESQAYLDHQRLAASILLMRGRSATDLRIGARVLARARSLTWTTRGRR
jgi:hypothetical protein